jgi:hypothetical protein
MSAYFFCQRGAIVQMPGGRAGEEGSGGAVVRGGRGWGRRLHLRVYRICLSSSTYLPIRRLSPTKKIMSAISDIGIFNSIIL